jgi:hypothetical protein
MTSPKTTAFIGTILATLYLAIEMKIANFRSAVKLSTRLALLWACTAFSLSAAISPEQHTVDFSKSDDLKDIFDAGLRPRQYLGLPGGCELQHENLKILLPKNTNFDIEIDNAEISVLAGNEIASMDFNCDPQPIAQATAKARKLCQQLGIDTSNFDTYLEARGRGDFKIHSKPLLANINGIKIYVIFDDPSLVRAGISVDLIWPIPNEKMEFITGPMKPPQGYESFSMAPPADDVNQVPNPVPVANEPTSQP